MFDILPVDSLKKEEEEEDEEEKLSKKQPLSLEEMVARKNAEQEALSKVTSEEKVFRTSISRATCMFCFSQYQTDDAVISTQLSTFLSFYTRGIQALQHRWK